MANLPRLLYENQDFFRLQLDGQYYDIDEPADWDKVRIKLVRDKDYWGFNYEFIDAKVQLLFAWAEGGEVLEGAYNLKGSDAKVGFEYGYFKNNQRLIQYAGTVNFNTRQIDDVGFTAQIEKVVFDSLLRTRYETKVTMTATTDLSNNPITPPAPILCRLHSSVIRKYGSATRAEEVFEPTTLQTAFFRQTHWLQPDTTNVIKSEVEEMQPMPLAVADDPLKEDRFQFKATEAGSVLLRMKQRVRDRIDADFSGNAPFFAWSFVPAIRIRRNGQVVVEKTFAVPNNSGYSRSFFLDVTWDFVVELSAQLLAGDEVYFEMRFKSASIQARHEIVEYDGTVEVIQQTLAPSSVASGYRYFDILTHVAKAITGGTATVQSDYFGPGGCGYRYFITNGYQVRLFSTSDKPVQATLKQLIEDMSAIKCLAIQYVETATGTVIKIEPLPAFFREPRIMAFLDTIWDVKEKHEETLVYNEAEVGYSKSPTDEVNSLEEYNTVRNYLLPITTYKQTYTAKSNFIAAGTMIEAHRREQFKVNPSTSLSNDDDLFFIATVDDIVFSDLPFYINSYAGEPAAAKSLIWLGRGVELGVGETFAFASGLNAGKNFTVLQATGKPGEFLVADVATQEAGTTSVTVVTSGSDVYAERNENFAVVAGISSPGTAYNLRDTPSQILFNHAPVLNIGLSKKLSSDVIINTFAKNNGQLKTQFVATDTCSNRDNNLAIKEDGDIMLSDYQGSRAIMQPMTVTFKTELRYDLLSFLKDRLLGIGGDGLDYGCIAFLDPRGAIWEGPVFELDYDPYLKQLAITARKQRKIV